MYSDTYVFTVFMFPRLTLRNSKTFRDLSPLFQVIQTLHNKQSLLFCLYNLRAKNGII